MEQKQSLQTADQNFPESNLPESTENGIPYPDSADYGLSESNSTDSQKSKGFWQLFKKHWLLRVFIVGLGLFATKMVLSVFDLKLRSPYTFILANVLFVVFVLGLLRTIFIITGKKLVIGIICLLLAFPACYYGVQFESAICALFVLSDDEHSISFEGETYAMSYEGFLFSEEYKLYEDKGPLFRGTNALYTLYDYEKSKTGYYVMINNDTQEKTNAYFDDYNILVSIPLS